MKIDNYEEIYDLIDELSRRKRYLESEIESNDLKINRIDSQISFLLNKEDDNFKFFSPRAKSNLYKEEVQKYNFEKAEYEEQNSKLLSEKSKIESVICILKKVIEDRGVDDKLANELNHNTELLNREREDKKVMARELYDHFYREFSDLNYKLELCINFMNQDPKRAKSEMESVSFLFVNLMSQIKKLVFELDPEFEERED